MSERRKYRNDAEYMDALEAQIETLEVANVRLRNRVWALCYLAYPSGDAPREAVAGDIGWPTQGLQSADHAATKHE